jgi:hypothetical protein
MITKDMIDAAGLEEGYTLVTSKEFQTIGHMLLATKRVVEKLMPIIGDVLPEKNEQQTADFSVVLAKLSGLIMNPAKLDSVKKLFSDEAFKADFKFIIETSKAYGIR